MQRLIQGPVVVKMMGHRLRDPTSLQLMCPGGGWQPVLVVGVDGRPQVFLDPLVRPHVGQVPYGDLARPVAEAGQVHHDLGQSMDESLLLVI